MRRTLTAVLCLTFVFAGCKAKELASKAAISADLEKRGTTDLMKEVAKDEYTAPEDGRLTDAQVQMYLKVREHEKTIAKVAKAEMQKHAEDAKKAGEKSIAGMMDGFKALGSAADFATADIRASKDVRDGRELQQSHQPELRQGLHRGQEGL
jgi:nitrous oxide reductase accessory protein NosL